MRHTCDFLWANIGTRELQALSFLQFVTLGFANSQGTCSAHLSPGGLHKTVQQIHVRGGHQTTIECSLKEKKKDWKLNVQIQASASTWSQKIFYIAPAQLCKYTCHFATDHYWWMNTELVIEWFCSQFLSLKKEMILHTKCAVVVQKEWLDDSVEGL